MLRSRVYEMQNGLSQPVCSQEQLQYLESKAADNLEEYDYMMFWNKKVKYAKKLVTLGKSNYNLMVDNIADRLKAQINDTSEDSGDELE